MNATLPCPWGGPEGNAVIPGTMVSGDTAFFALRILQNANER